MKLFDISNQNRLNLTTIYAQVYEIVDYKIQKVLKQVKYEMLTIRQKHLLTPFFISL